MLPNSTTTACRHLIGTVPLFKGYGVSIHQPGYWSSYLNLMNQGQSDAIVSVVFYDDSGASTVPPCLRYDDTVCELTNPFILPAGDRAGISLYLIGGDLADGRYSSVISSDQPIAGLAWTNGNDY